MFQRVSITPDDRGVGASCGVINNVVRVFLAMSPAGASLGRISVGVEGLGHGYVEPLSLLQPGKLGLGEGTRLPRFKGMATVFPAGDHERTKTKIGCLVRGGY